jgi:predicted 3-demethylubiquinone-9 3-methyltransferase (glyoxalase superfamily)
MEIQSLDVQCLNGGPHFKFNPSMSFFASLESEEKVKNLWAKLSEGGTVRMALDKYPWSEIYGWTTDKFGVEWQLIIDKEKQIFAPAFLFVDALFGKGEEAIKFYTSLFPNSKIETMHKDPEKNSVMHSAFKLCGQDFVLMEGDGKHGHQFNEAFSISVSCDTQSEIDNLWSKLTDGGKEVQCGWLKDKYGVSWQIVPNVLGTLMSGPKADKVMAAMMKMKKMDIELLKIAAE